MAGRIRIEVTNDEVAKDLAQKLVLFPHLPWVLVNRVALKFKEKGRYSAFSESGPTSLGVAEPWAPENDKAKSIFMGQARQGSFVYSAKQSKKNAIVKIGHPLANVFENPVGTRRAKRVIPFLTTFAKQFRSQGIAEQIVNEALENIARDGQP